MKGLVLSTVVLAWVLTVMPALAAAPTLAQTEGEQYREVTPGGSAGAIARGPGDPPVPDLPDYVLSEDGIVTIDGDASESCGTFASSIPAGEDFPTSVADAPPDFPLADPSPDFEQARSVLEQCEQRGLLPLGDQYAANTPTRGQQPPVAQAELPATGGSDLSMPRAPLAGGVLLVVLTVLGIVARRLTS